MISKIKVSGTTLHFDTSPQMLFYNICEIYMCDLQLLKESVKHSRLRLTR